MDPRTASTLRADARVGVFRTRPVDHVTRIEQMLRGRIGLDSGTIGASSIHRVVRLRMKALGLTDLRAYESLLNQSRPEWTELLETIVVKETWFFRDGEPFQAFVRLVREQWLTSESKRVRVLS